MLYEVAALPFKAHANYGTWSLDFDYIIKKYYHVCDNCILYNLEEDLGKVGGGGRMNDPNIFISHVTC